MRGLYVVNRVQKQGSVSSYQSAVISQQSTVISYQGCVHAERSEASGRGWSRGPVL